VPDLEQRIREGLDRLTEWPDPGRIVRQVDRRRRHIRAMRRVQAATLVVAVLAGVGGGTYALAKVFGAGSTQVPGHKGPSPTPSVTAVVALCTGGSATLKEDALPDHAAGTTRTLWRVTNSAAAPCRSFGFPAVEVHTASGWQTIAAQQGGFPDIERQPASVVAAPGGSLYFVTYWNDVTSSQGPCVQFDRIRVTLPDDRTPIEAAVSDCMNSTSLREGPLAKSPPG
jgi:hypothetical protein